MEKARRLKPAIPLIAKNNIPLRDEIRIGDDPTLFRARNKVGYAEFRTMPSKVIIRTDHRDYLFNYSA
jgi:hypothetical protein